MKLYVNIPDRKTLPEIDKLIEFMWKKNVSISKAADAERLRDCTTLAICWDKWVDDNRWVNNCKFKEYIYFNIPKKIQLSNPIIVEIADDAVLVDKRAVYKAVLLIASCGDGLISKDRTIWLSKNEFEEQNKKLLICSFEDAVEISLRKEYN